MFTTVTKLINQLQELENDGLGDVGVRIAVQPNWPIAHYVENVKYIENEEYGEYEDCGDEGYVWIAASESGPYNMPYAPREAWEEWE